MSIVNMDKNMRRFLAFGFATLLAIVVLTACGEDDPAKQQREAAVQDRAAAMAVAESLYPAPDPANFPIRGALVKFTDRQDMIAHPWYIYILGMNGQYVGYFVGQTYPVNSCNFLSSTEDIRGGTNGNVVVTAPSYDGVYYGESQCDVYFFFDVETDAMHTFKAPMWFASDVPLDLDVPRLDAKQGG